MAILKLRFWVLAWAALGAGLTLTATAALAFAPLNTGQQPTFEPVSTVLIPTIDFSEILPTPEPMPWITTPAAPALPTQQYFQVPAELVATPPWQAASPTPAPVPQAQPDILRAFLLACLLLLAMGSVLGLVYWLATRLPGLIRRAQQPHNSIPKPPAHALNKEPAVHRTAASAAPPPPPQPTPAPSAQPEPTPPASPLADWLHEGIRRVRLGQFDAGIETLRQGLQRQSQNGEAWLWLGLAYLAKKDWRAAERCLYQAERLGHPRAAAALDSLSKLRPSGGSGAANAG